MKGQYTVTALIATVKEDTPEINIKLNFASQKVARDVRDQLNGDGFVATAQLIEVLD